MKFTAAFAVLAAASAIVDAKPTETNGQRMARGLPPLPPTRRAPTVVAAARRGGPSSTPNQCNSGPVQCCDSVQNSDSSLVSILLGLLGIIVPANTQVGVTCSPATVVGASGTSCSQQTVCCDNNSFNGLVAIGCTPININL